MDKEKILEAARSNKYRGKEYENEQGALSSMLSVFLALIVGVTLFLLEYFTKGTINIGLIVMIATVGGADALYEGIKLKVRRKIVWGVVCSLTAIIAIASFVGQVVQA